MQSNKSNSSSSTTTSTAKLEGAAVNAMRIENIRLPAGVDPTACDEALIAELTSNIRVLGLVNPVTVRQTPDGFILVAGLHRLVAAQRLGLAEIPVRVVAANDRKARAITLAENIVRAHRPSRAAALKELHDLLSEGDTFDNQDRSPRTPEAAAGEPGASTGPRPGTITATAAVAGVSRTTASKALKRARAAAPAVAEAEASGKIAASAVDELTRLTPVQQVKVLPLVVGRPRDEVRAVVDAQLGGSVKPIRKAIAKFMSVVNAETVATLPPADRRAVTDELKAAVDHVTAVLVHLKVQKVA
jgi:hypothetical protein